MPSALARGPTRLGATPGQSVRRRWVTALAAGALLACLKTTAVEAIATDHRIARKLPADRGERHASFPGFIVDTAKAVKVKAATSSMGVALTPAAAQKRQVDPVNFFRNVFEENKIGKVDPKSPLFKTKAFKTWVVAIFNAIDRKKIYVPDKTAFNSMDKTYDIVFAVLLQTLDSTNLINQIKRTADRESTQALAFAMTWRVIDKWIKDGKRFDSKWAIHVADLVKYESATRYSANKYLDSRINDKDELAKIKNSLHDILDHASAWNLR